MQVVACAAPTGLLEPAPLTSLPLELGESAARLSAFWSGDDAYFVRCVADQGDEAESITWYRADCDLPAVSASQAITDAERARLGRLMMDVIPMGGGRVAFPVGSTGRVIYRVWRSKAGGASRSSGRTRILGVRAGRSLRQPA